MKRPNGYWIKERVFEESKKYETRNEFQKGCGSAYEIARRNGWLSEMTWFKELLKPKGYWSKENVFAEAKKYHTRSDFQRCNKGAYKAARKNGWLDEMDWLENGNIKKFVDNIDCVYKYYFNETKSIYIGRTIHKKKRDIEHLFNDKDAVFIHARENGLAVPPMEIIEDNLTVVQGQEREGYWVNYYKEKGYNILNRIKTGKGCGSLGSIGRGKWTKENVFEEARKYETKSEFEKGCGSAYEIARRNGWLSEMTWFKELLKPKGYWSKENVFEESRKYQTRFEFSRGSGRAYEIARRNGWLKEMFWFKERVAHNKKWTKETVFEESRKYQTRFEFSRGSGSAYQVALRNGWLEEMNWLKEIKKPANYWSIENVFKEAKKYKKRGDFAIGCGSAYNVARRYNLLDELFPKKCVA